MKNPLRFWKNYVGKPTWTWRAWLLGFQDGLKQPFDLGSGMTYECTRLNTVYDQGANFGQYVGTYRVQLQKRWSEETASY